MNKRIFFIAAFISAMMLLMLGAYTVEAGKESVRLQDIDVLTFTSGDFTRGRRRAGVPQLKNVGGTAKGKYEPHTAMCKNIGFDGHDVAWKCEADLPNEYTLGKVTVTCEGYDYPEDSYVLKDSCGLEYKLEYSETGRQQPRDRSDHYEMKNRRREHGFIAGIFYSIYDLAYTIISFPFQAISWVFSFFFKTGATMMKIGTAFVAMFIGLNLFRMLTKRRESYKQYPTSAGRPVQGMGPAGLAGGSKEQSTGPGFWTGVLGGSVATYFLNRNSQNRDLYQRPDGTWSRVPADLPADSPPPAPLTHESTAYGTTKRR